MKYLFPSIIPAVCAILMMCEDIKADVGQCWVMFVFSVEDQLNAEQLQEVGRSIMRAHEKSRQSDGHILFICLISRNRQEREILYRIDKTAMGTGIDPVHGYRITASNFLGIQHAVAEVEAAFRQGRIYQVKSGARKNALDEALYERSVRSY